MKRYLITIILLLLSVIILIIISRFYVFKNEKPDTTNTPPQNNPASISIQENTVSISIEVPLDNASARITKKPFGIEVSPDNSPVTPEKFSGFHTGTDFETLDSKSEEDVAIKAICDGEIIQKKSVNGYGGVIIQKCQHNNNPILVLYGHIILDSSTKEKEIKKEDFVALLSPAYSPGSGFERKHLHLGIIKGEKINYLGYVPTEKELSNWIDSEIFLQKELRN
ncbi:MAG: M23 family metallopeptidase [Parcubacteria group bacterium]|jgi:hypothetical protein